VEPILGEVTLFGVTRPIGGYGVAVTVGILVTAALMGRAAWRAREDVGATIATIGYATMAGFAGAFLLFAVVEAVRTGDPLAIRHHGGLVFYGAVPTALVATMLAARSFELPWLKIVDLAVPGLALGHALGRIGCFLGGCCYGAEWHGPWAATATHPLAASAHPSVPRHPVQLYESLGLLVIAALFALRRPERVGDGGRALAYLGAYAILRIGVEQLRDDSVRGVFLGISTSTLISLALLGTALVWGRRVWTARRAQTA
jgi:phosphatidylglycerol:prolipoprotein diacylglycerol transferase